MNGILIFISVLAFSINGIMTRTFQIKLQNSSHSIKLYQASFTLVASLAYFALSFMQSIPLELSMILPAAMFGICFAFASLFSAKCMDMGYMSISSVIVNLSLVLPVIFSWTVMHEPVSSSAVIGLMFMLITLVLSSSGAKKGDAKSSGRWLLYVIIAFFANGGSAIVQKQYKSSFGEGKIMLFMGIAYLVSSLIFSATYMAKNSKSNIKFKDQIKNPLLFLLLVLISGLGSFGGNGLLGILCDKVNGGILYPCINGGLCIVIAISSFVIFKEKITCKKIIAICTGIFAIVLLNI